MLVDCGTSVLCKILPLCVHPIQTSREETARETKVPALNSQSACSSSVMWTCILVGKLPGNLTENAKQPDYWGHDIPLLHSKQSVIVSACGM